MSYLEATQVYQPLNILKIMFWSCSGVFILVEFWSGKSFVSAGAVVILVSTSGIWEISLWVLLGQVFDGDRIWSFLSFFFGGRYVCLFLSAGVDLLVICGLSCLVDAFARLRDAGDHQLGTLVSVSRRRRNLMWPRQLIEKAWPGPEKNWFTVCKLSRAFLGSCNSKLLLDFSQI